MCIYIYNQAIIDAANLDGCGKWKNLGTWISPATAIFFCTVSSPENTSRTRGRGLKPELMMFS